ncbi:cuticle protein 18.7-like [Microplitis mediator]|uniref:cuticle protein 18.7-like n=1 Tax=Microplitis mediator TaxID=375433 RepID=UPI00255632D9|nr:cuticle protein 18.7-like [Microplitis mediator]
MNKIILILSLIGVAVAKPSALFLSPGFVELRAGAPIGFDGKVVDTPEVALAKAEHAAAHINERLSHGAAGSVALPVAKFDLSGGAPIGVDGRVVDTPEVAFAKAEHAAAHINEQLEAGSVDTNLLTYKLAKLQPGAPIGLDGRVLETPEVALARAEHAAAHFNERLNHASEGIKNSAFIPVSTYSYIAPSPFVHYYV